MRLDVGLLHLRHFTLGFENLICFGKTFFYIADVDPNLGGQVLGRVRPGEIDIFRFIVNPNCAVFHRLAHIQNGGEHFVFDLDQTQGFFGNLRGFGGHKGHAIAHEADLEIQREGVQRPGERVALSGGRINHAGNILPGQNGGDTWQGAGFGRIDVLNQRMRVRRAQHLGVEQSARFDIRRKSRFTLDELDRVQLLFRFPHGLINGVGRRNHQLGADTSLCYAAPVTRCCGVPVF